MLRDVPLADRNDLEARIGTLTDDQAARVAGLLADASAEVRSAAGQHITHVQDDTATIRPIGRRLTLPQRPVTAVASVVDAVTGATVPTTDWAWDGLDRVTIAPTVTLSQAYAVTYDHGYFETPPMVVAIVCGAVNRVLTASSVVDGITSVTIGQYSEQTPSGSSGVQVRLTSREEKRLRRRFGRGSTTVLTGG